MYRRYDFDRLGKTHGERMLEVLDTINKHGSMTVETFCEKTYNGDYTPIHRSFWETAYNDLGILGLADLRDYHITNEGFNFLKAMRKKGKIR